MTSKYELCVTSSMENLTLISDFVTSVAGQMSLDEDQTFALQMAIDEACANVMEHAYGGQGHGTIRICCHADEDEVIVTIHDQGRPFDPQSVPRPNTAAPLEQREEGALGLYLMEKLMDWIGFEFDPIHGNTLTMRKKISYEKPTLRP
ncbi:MAG: ATP-binding protein [Chloroflexi bacterium]|nr:ATP-binding protein [Chloroflexota bacterium]